MTAVFIAMAFLFLTPGIPALAAGGAYHFSGQWSGSRFVVTVTVSYADTQVNAGAFLLGYNGNKLVLLNDSFQDAQSGEGILPGGDVMALAGGSDTAKKIAWFNWIALSGGSPGSFTGTAPKEIAKLYFRLADGVAKEDLNTASLFIPTGQEALTISKLAKPLILAYGGTDIPENVTADFSYPGSSNPAEDGTSSAGGGGGAADTEDPVIPDTAYFNDVPAGVWYEAFVYDLTSRGILQGKTATSFAPNDAITRGEFAAILARMSGETMPQAEKTFCDVAADAWYASYIAWASVKGIAQGSGIGFAPNANITREEMALMLYRYVQNVSGATLPDKNATAVFTDDQNIASYAKEAVTAMQRGGILGGKESNRFAPKDNATRAEAAKMISLLLAAIGK